MIFTARVPDDKSVLLAAERDLGLFRLERMQQNAEVKRFVCRDRVRKREPRNFLLLAAARVVAADAVDVGESFAELRRPRCVRMHEEKSGTGGAREAASGLLQRDRTMQMPLRALRARTRLHV